MPRFVLQTAIGILTLWSAANGTVTVAGTRIAVETPMPLPNWALLERELLQANAKACREFFDRYFDERGYLQCVERWGGDDGPDDAIENCLHWPALHALGASDDVLKMYKKAWEGHLRQYTAAKTVDVPFARDGMYYKEFPVKFDWLHNAEGLVVFCYQGLSDPHDPRFRTRARRYAGFYMNEDPQAPNYDPKHRMIKSMFTGSRGPLLRKATGLDWAGDPIEVKGRFHPGHGEDTYEQMLAHFKDYNDVIGDHPQNLLSTALAMNAYMLEQEPKYKNWVLEYVNAWRERMIANGNIIPTNIGLDGKIGSAAGGKWYGGVYGWGFSVVVPQNGSLAHRNGHHLGFDGFMNAFLLTGNHKFLDPWRKQIDIVNSHKKTIDGRTMYPHSYGDDGWYNYKPQKYGSYALDLYYMSMKPEDRERAGSNAWLAYLDGKNPGYPEQILRGDFSRIRSRNQAMKHDTTTPDTRLADDSMKYNPASVSSLIRLVFGGLVPRKNSLMLYARLRYFDPDNRRAGLPEGVAALIDKLADDLVAVTLVNTNQLESRRMVVQGGAYGEHQFIAASSRKGEVIPIDAADFEVDLAPGTGTRLVIQMKRHANQPTLVMPWDR